MDWYFVMQVGMAATCAAAFLFSVSNFRNILAQKRRREEEEDREGNSPG